MAAIGTWAFSEPAVERIRSLVSAGLHATDVVERAVAEVEDDGETGRFVVGRGGFPTSAGVLECDAAIMEGVAGRFGGVASLRGVGTPIRVARRVMDRSPHSLLVGEGAAAFAQDQGFPLEPNESLLTPSAVAAYQEFLEKQRRVPGHDTLGLIALDLQGGIAVGVSSSGVPFKSPGRVGDSPLPGCGLYADDTAGAAAATGDGDKIMCFCPSFHTVQLMKQGLPPTEACEAVLRDVARRTAPDEVFELGLVAMNMKVHTMGEAGAAATMEFPYTFWNSGKDSVQKCVQEPVAGLNIL
ncbi:N(4)-(beta-N-acetylglucosaminyl)-L-asparaginase isoform X1 [Scleropages formosus]|uniref:N(4)-(beta-N-acetylglucosaminyl)-L-asparaginase isoform X1 n=1 Tax=Scleropages formosus TaxID=113540 RepID=UPI0010FA6B44|nr:N(4)-(beta-N-acetylglucosaminyl)-L-asparaginase-like isoform X1 [Scleropages formosus]XP_029107264.1 N(4)-(beta-N-acetylglucosaminyl)-L-asparaginase-like isoform X1 [Scleropages formosus]XP_029107265.1 N(4)-(beta-N-acetylglucosaminyl)-L-asparaginase-like isoform X1 [Scleropages formosus]